jgi:hypothetical protein
MRVALAFVLFVGAAADGSKTADGAPVLFETTKTFSDRDNSADFGTPFTDIGLQMDGNGRWYTFNPGAACTSTAGCSVSFETPSAGYDTYMYLVKEDCKNNPGVYSQVAYNDDGAGFGTDGLGCGPGRHWCAKITERVYHQYRYFIGVGSYGSGRGWFKLEGTANAAYQVGGINCRKFSSQSQKVKHVHNHCFLPQRVASACIVPLLMVLLVVRSGPARIVPWENITI